MTSLHFTFIINPFQPRAQNEARLRRHKEVEEDKKSAGSGQGKGQQGRDTSTTAGDDETPFRNPFGSTTKKPDGPTKKPDGAGPSALRSSAAPRPAVAAGGVGHSSKRLGDNDGPPPDPGYRWVTCFPLSSDPPFFMLQCMQQNLTICTVHITRGKLPQ